MRRDVEIKGLYAIADNVWNPFGSLSKLVNRFLKGGCRIVQLRIKPASRDEAPFVKTKVKEEAADIMSLKGDFDFTFIINDHHDIAAEVGADGVHVGESDGPIADIRRAVGESLLIGYSSHSIDEAKKAAADGADYVAFGAVFPTRTKGPSHPVQGLAKLRDVVESIDRPVVAIGGIGRTNIDGVLETGVASVAMITALSNARDVTSETRWFVERMESRSRGL